MIVWISFAIVYIRFRGYLIYVFRVLPKERAEKFPFGVKFSSE